ncbi:DNA-binding protein [Prodigiosinella confusarubida]|uniref:DNA-binding protein n=1 Tax=Serratia sp. (strain ATCC 39006) TaxID=104623 RepID=A0A2I5TKT8_SERS3|nr:phage antirepressor KilAC domain-containing protein [Serratia sp. ATCC 39006]AUH00853.1 DNA-binding protein [Serratia sp. ATCC 39006]AUH05175.1 DNA-binding protein [Serratia sp. ATCC 39006]
MTKSTVTNKSLPVIAGVDITTDAEGRFNLNALHKASGAEKKNGPSYWLVLDGTKQLIAELETQTTQISVVTKEGRNGGTFAHELLAVEYAGWISPAFRLQVNQTFIDYRSGKLAPVADPMKALSDPATMRGLLLVYTEKVLDLEHQVDEMRPDVEAFDRIATKSDGSMCITDAAKHLQVQPKFLFKTLSENHWIYRRAGGKAWLGYQDKIQSGYLEHKVTTVSRSDGSEKIVEQVLVTAKGIAKISKMLGVSGVAA